MNINNQFVPDDNSEKHKLAAIQKHHYINRTGDIIYVLQHCASKSTIHGINHFVQAKSIDRRLLWLAIGISVSIGFLFNLFMLVEKYLQNPILTDYHHEALPFVYPDLSFCVINPIYFPPKNSKQYHELIRVYDEYRTYINTADDAYMHYRRVKLSDYLYINSQDIYSHKPWSAIIDCKFMGMECNYTHFEMISQRSYGNCFTFNVSKLVHNKSPENLINRATDSSFSLIVYKALTIPKYYHIDPFDSLFIPSGIMIIVHDKETFMFPGDSFIVESYAQFNIKIAQKHHLNLKNRCNNDTEYFLHFDLMRNRTRRFKVDRASCLNLIVQKAITKYCECQLRKFPRIKKDRDIPFCFHPNSEKNLTDLSSCFQNATGSIDRLYLRKKCLTDKCHHSTFDIVISQSKFPAINERKTYNLWIERLSKLEDYELEYYQTSDLLKHAFNIPSNYSHRIKSIKDIISTKSQHMLKEEFIDKNFVQMKFIPGSLYMDKIVETIEYPLSRLLSDIGGCVGLWVGASLITLFELVDLVTELWRIFTVRQYQVTLYQRYMRKQFISMKKIRNDTNIISSNCIDTNSSVRIND